MKLFWIAPYLPAPQGSGGDLRSYYLLRQMKKFGATIEGWCQGIHDQKSRKFFDNVTIQPVSRPLMYGRALWGRLGGTPFSYGRYYDPMIEKVIPDDFFPYFDHLHMSVNLEDPNSRNYWMDEHNLEFILWQEFSQSCGNVKKWFMKKESKLVRNFEWERIDSSRGTSLPSGSNLEKIPDSCREKVTIIPNGVSDEWLDYGKRNLKNDVDSVSNFGYIGSYKWPPNREAISYFLKKVWIPYHENNQRTQFIIAGSDPKPDWEKITGVNVMGYVDRSDRFFDLIDVLVVPLSIGAGTRLKILESSARAIPVISTEKGIEGLQLPAVFTVDSRQNLNLVMNQIRGTNQNLQDIREQNFETVKSQYHWDKIGQKLWNALNKIT